MGASSTLTINATVANSPQDAIGPTFPGDQLLVSGSGAMILNGSDTYTGGTKIGTGATLNIGNVAALGSGSASTVTFVGNSTLQAGAGVSGGTVANALAISAGVMGTLDTQSNVLTLSGLVSGGGSLAKIGNGTLTLAGSTTAIRARPRSMPACWPSRAAIPAAGLIRSPRAARWADSGPSRRR